MTLIQKESIHQSWQCNETFVSDQQLRNSPPRSNWHQVFRHVKCGGGDLKIWFVAHSMFLTDHWNIPAQITRWITASLLWDMLDTLFCYLSFNRQLIALLSARCLRSTLHSVTHSPWPHCVSNGWGKRRQTLTQWSLTQAISIFRDTVEKARWKYSFCILGYMFSFLFFFSLYLSL